MTLKEALNQESFVGGGGKYYISPQGWMIRTSDQCDGTLIDPTRKVTMWTGHHGEYLDPTIYPLTSPVEELASLSYDYKAKTYNLK